MDERSDFEADLLLGLLALQNGFIGPPELASAVAGWAADAARPIAARLEDAGALDPQTAAVLRLLVDRRRAARGDGLRLTAAEIADLRSTLEATGDPAAAATITHLWPDGATVDAPAADGPTDAFTPDDFALGRVGPRRGAGAGRFHVLRPHARGNLGVVSIAYDRELDREVALKQVRDDQADRDDRRSQFVREAELTGQLEHPGIVPVYSLGADEAGRPYYAMRFVRGETLRAAIGRLAQARAAAADDRARAGLRVAEGDLLRRFLVVCDAVAYAHSRGVIHRDLKPANVLLGRFGETLVADWGLAKPVGLPDGADPGPEGPIAPRVGSDSLPGFGKGTPQFMSPEQAAGQLDRLGPPSDVFSLGATLYCLLTGDLPYHGSMEEVLEKARRADFRPPRTLDPAIPRTLEAICLKAMAFRPEDRYADAAALADDLRLYFADEPTAALAERWPDRLARWSRRHRAWVRAGAAALALVALTATLAAVGVARERDRADAERFLAVQARDREAQARVAAEQARRREAQARGDAEREYRTARALVGKIMHTVASPEMAALPHSERLRRSFGNHGLGVYQQLLRAHPDDPAIQAEAALGLRVVANIHRMIGDVEACGPLYDRAVALLDGLLARPGAGAEWRPNLAETLIDRGESNRLNGRQPPAQADFDRALTLIGELRAAEPAEPRWRRAEAVARMDLADSLIETGRFADRDRPVRRGAAGRRPRARTAGRGRGGRGL